MITVTTSRCHSRWKVINHCFHWSVDSERGHLFKLEGGHFGGSGQWLKRKINTDHLLSKHLNNDKCPNIVKLITHVSKCIDNRKVPKIAPMPPILYEKYTWLHFTALIIKSYLHWEVQNIHIPFVPYIKENFLYPFVIWKPAWKPPLYYGYSVDLASFPLPL